MNHISNLKINICIDPVGVKHFLTLLSPSRASDLNSLWILNAFCCNFYCAYFPVDVQSSFVDTNPLYNDGVLPKDLEDGRLPTSLHPSRYYLEIQPDIYTEQPPFYSTGIVSITFRASEETNQIVLNYHELAFIDGSLAFFSLNFSAPAPNIVGWGVIPNSDFFIITLDDNMNLNQPYVFRVSFISRVVPAAERYGLYWDSYMKDGELRLVRSKNFSCCTIEFLP